MKISQKGSIGIILILIIVFAGLGFCFYKNHDSKKIATKCPVTDIAPEMGFTYAFSLEKLQDTNTNFPHTRVVLKVRDICNSGDVASNEYRYDLGTYTGSCIELTKIDKDITGSYPEENVKARVQCMYKGVGKYMEIYQREDFIAHIADIKESVGDTKAFKGPLKDLPMLKEVE